jgi:hypothetical protein
LGISQKLFLWILVRLGRKSASRADIGDHDDDHGSDHHDHHDDNDHDDSRTLYWWCASWGWLVSGQKFRS